MTRFPISRQRPEGKTLNERPLRTGISIDLDSKMASTESNLKNIGYAIIKDLYKQLGLDKF